MVTLAADALSASKTASGGVLGGMTEPTELEPMRLQPLRAMKAMRKLLADKEDTVQVFEIMRALSGRSVPNGYKRLLSTTVGGRIAYEHKEMAAKFSDPAWLAQFPEGTVGAAYRHFMQSENLSAEGLAQESRKVSGAEIDVAHPFAWYGRRLRDIHDVWHVLSGYGRDALGEACVVAFSYAQTRSTGFAFIALAGGNKIARELPGRPVRAAVWQAYQNGKAAAWLPGQDYEKLFAEPLEAARKRLNIAAPSFYRAVGADDRGSVMQPMKAAAA